MKLSGFRDMDPHLLVGLVNTELRNQCDSLEDLVLKHDLDRQELEERLAECGFTYRSEVKQFR